MKKRLSIIVVLILLAVSVFFLFNIIGKPEIEYRINNITQEGANISVDISNRNIFNTQYWICIDENSSKSILIRLLILKQAHTISMSRISLVILYLVIQSLTQLYI